MYVEEIIALQRLCEAEEAVVSELASAVLDLIGQLRDARRRADLAEATLDVELRRIGDLRHRIADYRGGDPASLSRLLLELAEVAGR